MLLTSTPTTPAEPAAGASHSSAVELMSCASTLMSPMRHTAPAMKDSPCTLTAVEPRTPPKLGTTADTRAAASYTYASGPATSVLLPVSVTYTCASAAAGTAGATHTTDESSTSDAGTRTEPKRHCSCCLSAKPEPATVTRVAPVTGPREGVSCAASAADVYAKRVPDAEKSAPLLLISTVVLPAAREGAAHSASLDDSQRAPTTPDRPYPKRHASSAPLRKPLPTTVTTLPPDTLPSLGVTLDTCASAMYAYCTPSAVKSAPALLLTSMAKAASRGDAGVSQVAVVSDKIVAGTWMLLMLHERDADCAKPVPVTCRDV